MRNKQIFLISFIIYLCTISTVRAGEYHLLPEPQKFPPISSSFVLGRTKLSTPVLRQEWEAFVVDRGGVIDDKARASIEVKLVPSLEEVPLNADEAYRLVVNNGKVTVVDYDEFIWCLIVKVLVKGGQLFSICRVSVHQLFI